MTHATTYRGLQRLAERGMLIRREERDEQRGAASRVYYELTDPGTAAGQRATYALAALESPPRWIRVAEVATM
jgi:DNA-binding PadR family transcriptional regulator